MRLLIIPSMLLLNFLLVMCSQDNSVIPQPTPCNDITLCDTCDTYLPLTHSDSVWQIYPWSIYNVRMLRRTPDDKYYFGSCKYDWMVGNNFRFEPSTGNIDILKIDSIDTYYLGISGVEISPNGSKVMTNNPSGAIFIIDATTLYSTKIVVPAKFPSWSLDGTKIYYYQSSQTWVMNSDGSKKTPLVYGLTIPRQFDESRLLGVQTDGFYFFNMTTKEKTKCPFSIPAEHMEFIGTWDLSPDRTRALADFADTRPTTPEIRDENGYYGDGGLYLFDFKDYSVRKVLPGQYWGPLYDARWASNSTFFATYACRKDNAAMVYEFDLNGKTIRQVTFKEQKFYQ